MALNKDIPIRQIGGSASYHRILAADVRHVPDPSVPGCIGTVCVSVASYASHAARSEGANPLHVHDVMLRFGPAVSDRMKGVPVAVVQTSEPTRAELYAALDQSPIFAGAGAA